MSTTAETSIQSLVIPPAEFCKLSGLSRPTVLRMIEEGTIRATKLGSRYRIYRSEITRLLVAPPEAV